MKTNEEGGIRQPRTRASKRITPIGVLVRCFARCILLLGLVWLAQANVEAAAAADAPATLATQDLRVWVGERPIPGSQLQEVWVAKQLSVYEEVYPFSGQSVIGLGITGFVQFNSERSMVRVVMVDDQLHEYLVYEMYPLLASAYVLPIRDACQETCLLPPTAPASLKVELVDASLEIQTIVINQLMAPQRTRGALSADTVQQLENMKKAQATEIISVLNRQIQAKGLSWRAGETAISRLSYAEKKKLLSCVESGRDIAPNLQGAEYYTGGIFEVNPGTMTLFLPESASSSMIDSFDWSDRHGANMPGSPYYDGDPTGSGWMTSVKSQRCADCWAHSTLGAMEAQANLYFNQHVDLDLSEQELVSCSGAGSCQYGGNTGSALSYVERVGVVDEACFPESGTDEPCTNCCPAPRERIRIAGFEGFNPSWEGEDNIKRRLIKSGPLPFGISSWWHAMVLVGYVRDPATGETVWILKNSWGPSWGEQGYGYVKVQLSDIYLTYNLFSPVISQFTPYTVACYDADGDGYFNWGISDKAPDSCGKVPSIKDCDDSDPNVALLLENGACTAPPRPDTTPPGISIAATPSTLWSPNGKTVPVVVAGTITDADSGVDASTATYTVSDEYGVVQPNGRVPLESSGSYTITVLLEASRRGNDINGRQYIITVRAQDRSGNSAAASTVVTVLHDMGDRVVNDLLALAHMSTMLDAIPVEGGPAGTFRITAVFTNISTQTIRHTFAEVVALSEGNLLLNADDGPGGVGARVTLPSTENTLLPGATQTFEFVIGLQNREPFTFLVNIRGALETPSSPVADKQNKRRVERAVLPSGKIKSGSNLR